MKILYNFKFHFLISLIILTSSTLRSQNDSDKEKVEITPYSERPAEFPGGQNALICYIESELATQLLEISDTGSIMLTATLDKKGQIKNIQFNFGDESKIPDRMNPISNKTLEEEISKVFSDMPAWKPKLQNERPVQEKIIWPIKFPYELKCEDK